MRLTYLGVRRSVRKAKGGVAVNSVSEAYARERKQPDHERRDLLTPGELRDKVTIGDPCRGSRDISPWRYKYLTSPTPLPSLRVLAIVHTEVKRRREY